jgi:DNA polymerase-1
MKCWQDFKSIVVFDFEYNGADGNIPHPVCLVATEVRTGRVVQVWEDELAQMKEAPFDTGADTLAVVYYGSGDLQACMALNWQLPVFVLDLFAEFSARVNGLDPESGRGLVGAMAWYGLDSMDAQEKDSNRNLALRGGPWTDEERRRLLDYCAADVRGTAAVLDVMCKRGHINLPAGLLRGRFIQAIAHMEFNGIPVDTDLHALLDKHWFRIQDELIRTVDRFGIYDGRSFRQKQFAKFLQDRGITSWPRTKKSGVLRVDDDTFKMMGELYPELEELRQLRKVLGKMRLSDLPIGSDGRNRTLLSPFGASTSRCTPSTSKFAFSLAAWLRSLIRPQPGMAIAYLDWEQQEFGVAAALSGDENMMKAYRSGDPYIMLAKMCKAVPADATKQSHPAEREIFKTLILAIQYQMSPQSVATRLGWPLLQGEQYIALYKRTFPRQWGWSDGAVDQGFRQGKLSTVFGWPIHVTHKTRARSLRNFPSQANACEMMRLAACYLTEAQIRVACSVHDAFLIEAPATDIDETVRTAQRLMARASVDVLKVMELRSDAKVIRYPDRYIDPRGAAMWGQVMGMVQGFEAAG